MHEYCRKAVLLVEAMGHRSGLGWMPQTRLPMWSVVVGAGCERLRAQTGHHEQSNAGMTPFRQSSSPRTESEEGARAEGRQAIRDCGKTMFERLWILTNPALPIVLMSQLLLRHGLSSSGGSRHLRKQFGQVDLHVRHFRCRFCVTRIGDV